MAKKAHVKCDIKSGAGAEQERFEWYFSDQEPNISQYNAGVITTATMLCNPNSTVRLRVYSIRNGEEKFSEASMDIPSVSDDVPTTEELQAPTIGQLEIFEWVDV